MKTTDPVRTFSYLVDTKPVKWAISLFHCSFSDSFLFLNGKLMNLISLFDSPARKKDSFDRTRQDSFDVTGREEKEEE